VGICLSTPLCSHVLAISSTLNSCLLCTISTHPLVLRLEAIRALCFGHPCCISLYHILMECCYPLYHIASRARVHLEVARSAVPRTCMCTCFFIPFASVFMSSPICSCDCAVVHLFVRYLSHNSFILSARCDGLRVLVLAHSIGRICASRVYCLVANQGGLRS
jgi:hypothetical protein